MLEFILDIVFDLILEGSTMLLAETKVPMIIRVIAGIIVAGLFIGIAGLLIYIGYSSLLDKEYIGGLLLLGAVFLVVIDGFVYINKEFKKRKEDM